MLAASAFSDHEALWLFVLGQLVMFICWLFGGGYYMGKILARFAEALRRLGAIEARAERMDEHGTTYAKYNIEGETEKIGDIIKRVNKLEANARKLDVIEERVRAICSHMKIAEAGR